MLVLAGAMFDWGVMAVFTLLFLWAGRVTQKLKLAFAGAVLIFTAYNIWEGSYLFPVERNLFMQRSEQQEWECPVFVSCIYITEREWKKRKEIFKVVFLCVLSGTSAGPWGS